MNGLTRLSRAAYKVARASSDLNTLQRRGPAALVEKLARRRVRREVLQQTDRWFR